MPLLKLHPAPYGKDQNEATKKMIKMKLERANPVHESASCWTNVEMCITCPANMHQKFAKKKKKKKIYIFI